MARIDSKGVAWGGWECKGTRCQPIRQIGQILIESCQAYLAGKERFGRVEGRLSWASCMF